MNKSEDIKKIVQEKYAKIVSDDMGCCCCCGDQDETKDYTIFSESYDNVKGYNKEADMNLGCGLPTEFAGIKQGDHVLDLGSGAGNDCFVARAETGETGQVTGLDFTPEMVAKAKLNTRNMGFKNVEFVLGDIENIPLEANTQDVVISNCVLNLVPDKQKAFSEIFRVLKPGGHFCISDVVTIGDLPKELKHDAELYAGCVSGAIQKEAYLAIVKAVGFTGIEIKKDKEVVLPDEMLSKYFDAKESGNFKKTAIGIFSITVTANKI